LQQIPLPVEMAKNVFSSTWYQDIELAPGVWTHKPKNEQTDLWAQQVPDLQGRKMIDLGCNCGNYSFLAAKKGAAKVLGFEIGNIHFDRAVFTKQLRQSQGTDLSHLSFVRGNILDRLEVIKGFDTFNACNVLYLLGSRVHDLMKAIQNAPIDLIILQGQLKRKDRIGEYNRPGVRGYEKSGKTWGNILGTVEGLSSLVEKYGFKITKTYESRNWPLLIAKRTL
jgi:SAM-dependent methyltransferase